VSVRVSPADRIRDEIDALFAGAVHLTASGLRLLQDLRHALLDSPARLRPDTPTTNPASTETVGAAA
jgi:hypothetical protein